MKRSSLMLPVAFALGLCSCSGNQSSDAGATGTGGDTQYNTVSGSFSAPGISATFGGALQGSYDSSTAINPTGETSWVLVSSFADPNASNFVSANVSDPAGGSAIVAWAFSPPGAPTMGTLSCDGSPNLAILYLAGSDGSLAFVSVDGGCRVTFSGTSLVTSTDQGSEPAEGTYASHGSLSATLVAVLPDGGPSTGTMSATW